MAVFSCQLKKLEGEKRTYEVATEKLLQFAEVRLSIHIDHKESIFLCPFSWVPIFFTL